MSAPYFRLNLSKYAAPDLQDLAEFSLVRSRFLWDGLAMAAVQCVIPVQIIIREGSNFVVAGIWSRAWPVFRVSFPLPGGLNRWTGPRPPNLLTKLPVFTFISKYL